MAAPEVEQKVSIAEKLAPWIGGGLLAFPVLVARYPPMTDLPHHENIIALLRYRNDPTYFPPGLYTYDNWGEPNQLFTLLGWPLSYVVPTDWACKILVAATVVLISAGAGYLASYLRVTRLTALVVAPAALGWTFYWGLIPNLVGIAAFLWLLPALDRAAERPSWKNALWGCVAMAVLYAAHEAMMVTACVAVAIFALGHSFKPKELALRVAPAAFATLLFVAQNRWQEHLKTPSNRAAGTTYLPIKHKVLTLPAALFGGHEEVTALFTFALAVLCILALGAERLRARGERPSWRPREAIHRLRFELFALFCFVAYLVMPYMVNGATLVYHRFLPPAYAVLAIAIAPRNVTSASIRRVVRLLPYAMPFASLLITWPDFADADRTYRDLDTLLPLIEKNSAVAQLELGTNAKQRVFSASSGTSRPLAVRGGRLLYSFTDSTIYPVQMDDQYRWNESLLRVMFDGYQVRPSWDADRYRYFLAHTPGGLLSVTAKRAMLPDAKCIGEKGEWLLFESTHEVMPLLSPDAPLPTPHPATLRKRMKEAYKEVAEDPEVIQELGRVPPASIGLPIPAATNLEDTDVPAEHAHAGK